MITRILAGLAVAAVVCAPLAHAVPAGDPPPYGGDPTWEAMAQDCHDGIMSSCDSLAQATRHGEAPVYHDYGFSCGGRATYDPGEAEGDYNTCVDQYGY